MLLLIVFSPDIFRLLICFLRSAIINLEHTTLTRRLTLFQHLISLFLVVMLLP